MKIEICPKCKVNIIRDHVTYDITGEYVKCPVCRNKFKPSSQTTRTTEEKK